MLRSSCESRSNSPAPVPRWDRLLGPLMRYSCLVVTLCVLSFCTNPWSCLATSLMSSCLYKGVAELVLVSTCFTSQPHEQDPNWRCFFYSCSCQVSQPLLDSFPRPLGHAVSLPIPLIEYPPTALHPRLFVTVPFN